MRINWCYTEWKSIHHISINDIHTFYCNNKHYWHGGFAVMNWITNYLLSIEPFVWDLVGVKIDNWYIQVTKGPHYIWFEFDRSLMSMLIYIWIYTCSDPGQTTVNTIDFSGSAFIKPDQLHPWIKDQTRTRWRRVKTLGQHQVGVNLQSHAQHQLWIST